MSAERKVPAIKPARPKKRTNRKRVILLVVFFVTLLAILFFQSSISKISEIEIVGYEMVSAEEIGQVSGITLGDSFFTIKDREVIANIEALQPVREAAIHKKFPGYVQIEVTEHERVAFTINDQGAREALLADGTAVPLEGLAIPLDRPILSGWEAGNPLMIELCSVLGSIAEPLLDDISEIVPDPSQAYEDKIRMYTKSQFEVSTRIALLAEKLQYFNLLVQEIKDQDIHAGVFTLMEQDRFLPVELEEEEAGNNLAE
ncbi:cell division protein FtsQ/DivIB [Paenibacillus senegalensis]|uniref:cell division protein FtsQ/DivIB n=1 Tax=Paenibacillus senegalensis TaxID=1465766 RepID=UPI000288D585|nr:FtsQ-type POTRA domain-containing protein [Paenibacillus senegalensis]